MILLDVKRNRFVFLNLRQKSQIEMRRKLQWTQTPPNLDDYAPECAAGPAPFQLAAIEGKVDDDGRGVKRERQVDKPPHGPSSKALKIQPPCPETTSQRSRGLEVQNEQFVEKQKLEVLVYVLLS